MEGTDRIEVERQEIEISGGRPLYSYTFTMEAASEASPPDSGEAPSPALTETEGSSA